MKNYTKSEEDHVETIIKRIADAGINVVIAGQSITEISKHYLEKYKIMIIRIMSKFELKRLAKAINAKILTRLGENKEFKDSGGLHLHFKENHQRLS